MEKNKQTPLYLVRVQCPPESATLRDVLDKTERVAWIREVTPVRKVLEVFASGQCHDPELKTAETLDADNEVILRYVVVDEQDLVLELFNYMGIGAIHKYDDASCTFVPLAAFQVIHVNREPILLGIIKNGKESLVHLSREEYDCIDFENKFPEKYAQILTAITKKGKE